MAPNTPQQKLWLIAILPTPEIQEEVTAFKQYAAEHFASCKALNAPPHITLQPPFKLEEGEITSVKMALTQLAGRHRPFPLRLRDFGAFPPRVFFVDLEASAALAALQKEVSLLMENTFSVVDKYKGRPFHPHMTVAFRDLRKKVFPQAWAHYSGLSYQREFLVDTFTLLRHSGARWMPYTDLPLTG